MEQVVGGASSAFETAAIENLVFLELTAHPASANNTGPYPSLRCPLSGPFRCRSFTFQKYLIYAQKI